jgi:sigma-B regulation protein RsbU (phosphoserine phosphatase)
MKKLRNKFLLYILAPALIALTVGAVLSFMVSHHIVTKQLYTIARMGLKRAADEVDVDLGRARDALKLTGEQIAVMRPADEDLRALFGKMTAETPIEVFFLIYGDGRIVAQDGRAEIALKTALNSEWLKRAFASDSMVAAAPFISGYTGELVNCSSLRLRAPDGETIGVLGYYVPTAQILEKAKKIELVEQFKGGRFAAFDRRGGFIVHTEEGLVGKNLAHMQDELHTKILEALESGREFWATVAETREGQWFAGFKKSRFADIYILAMVPLSSATHALHAHAVLSIIILFVCAGALWFILMRMAHKLAQPLNMLSDAAETLSKGNYPEPIRTNTEDELGQLVGAFNSMTQGLRQRDHIRNTFGRYLPEEVVETLLESEDRLSLGGEERVVTILMSDLRGFTAQTAAMAPDQVIVLLNRYLGAMIEIIMDHKGIVDEITGDGILAIFGAPQFSDDHTIQAALSAIAMQSEMARINELNEKDGFPELEMGVGVNTGPVVVGNIGSKRRTKYGAVGAVINMAGRIESYSVGGQILLSQSAYDKVKDRVEGEERFSVHMKGFDAPVALYDIGSMAPAGNDREAELRSKLAPLERPFQVELKRVENKLVSSAPIKASLTHLSPKGAMIWCEEPLQPRWEILLEILEQGGESYAPVFARITESSHEKKSCRALLRFTFVPRETRRLFSELPLKEPTK